MKTYEAYIHTNGIIQVKRMIPELGLVIDCSSPFVEKYLGTIEAEDYADAIEKFKKKQPDKRKEEDHV